MIDGMHVRGYRATVALRGDGRRRHDRALARDLRTLGPVHRARAPARDSRRLQALGDRRRDLMARWGAGCGPQNA